jgi:hypothetical protein
MLAVWKAKAQHVELVWKDGYCDNICEKCYSIVLEHWLEIQCDQHGFRLLDLRESHPTPLLHVTKKGVVLQTSHGNYVTNFNEFSRWLNVQLRATEEMLSALKSTAPTLYYSPDIQNSLLNLQDVSCEKLYANFLNMWFSPIGGLDRDMLLVQHDGGGCILALRIVRDSGENFTVLPTIIPQVSKSRKKLSLFKKMPDHSFLGSCNNYWPNNGVLLRFSSIPIGPGKNNTKFSQNPYIVSQIFLEGTETVLHCAEVPESVENAAIVVTYAFEKDLYNIWLVTPVGQRQLRGPPLGSSKEFPVAELKVRFSVCKNAFTLMTPRNKKGVRLINGYGRLCQDYTVVDYYTHDIQNPLEGTPLTYHRLQPRCKGLLFRYGDDYLIHTTYFDTESHAVDSIIAQEVCQQNPVSFVNL